MTRLVPTILVVEDDEAFRSVLVTASDQRGSDVQRAHPMVSQLRRWRELEATEPSTAIVVLTGHGSIATPLEAVRLGAVHYLTEPTDADRVLAVFDMGLAARPCDLLSGRTPEARSSAWSGTSAVPARA
jgi:two-component system response regulator RegA